MRKSTLFKLAAITLVAFSLSGCGSKNTGADAPTTEPKTEETPVVTEEPTSETEETTVDVTETAPVEETTGTEETQTIIPASELDGKTLFLPNLAGEPYDLIACCVDTCNPSSGTSVSIDDSIGFDFEVFGVKVSHDIETMTNVVNAFIETFGKPTGKEENDRGDWGWYSWKWEYDNGITISISYSIEENEIYEIEIMCFKESWSQLIPEPEEEDSTPALSLEGKSLVITTPDKSVDLLGPGETHEYSTYHDGFDFEVLGVKGSTDLSFKDELLEAFISYFGEATAINDETDLNYCLCYWEFDGCSIELTFLYGTDCLSDIKINCYIY